MAPLTPLLSLLPPWLTTSLATALPTHAPLLLASVAALAGAWALVAAARLIAAHRTLVIWPSPPTPSWLLGHAPALATPAHHLVLAAWAASHGRVYTLRVAWRRAVVVTDPGLAAAILDGRPGRTGLDKGDLYARFNALNPDPHRGTVFTSPSDGHWAAVRAAVAPCFTPRAVKARYGALAGPPAAAAAWLAARAKAGGSGGKKAGPTTTITTATTTTATAALFDADDLMMRAALDAVASACFGLTCGAVPAVGADPAPAIFEAMRACQDWLNLAAMAPWVAILGGVFGGAPALAGRAAMRAKRAYALGLAVTLQAQEDEGGLPADAKAQGGGGGGGGPVASTTTTTPAATPKAPGGGGGGVVQVEASTTAAPPPPSATTALLSILDPETGAPLSTARLAGEVVTLLEAGFETTGHTAAYTLALLARHPGEQAKVVAELASAGLVWRGERRPGRPLVHSDLAALPRLAACVKEAMRLFPVVADGPVRTAGRTVTVTSASASLTIPAGTLVLIPFFAAGRDGGAWGDASAFRPARWLEEEEEQDKCGAPSSTPPPHRLYAPFSRGARNCVGAALGQAMAVTLVAAVLARVRVGWPGVEEDGVAAPDLPPLEEGLEIRLTLQPKQPLLLTATAHGEEE